jgi:hypothetical protein
MLPYYLVTLVCMAGGFHELKYLTVPVRTATIKASAYVAQCCKFLWLSSFRLAFRHYPQLYISF